MNNLTNKKAGMLASVSILICLSLTACGNNDSKSSTTTTQSSVQQKATEQPNTNNENKKNEKLLEKQNNNKKVAQNTSNLPKVIKQQLDKNTKPKFSTAWKASTGEKLSACIEGKGSEAAEEGVGKILIKDIMGNITSFELADKKISPRYIEWADGENLLVILGASHGTISKGGNLYMINASTGEVFSVIETTDKKQQIMSVKKSGNSLNLKLNVFDDDNFDKSHTENWSASPFSASMDKTMEVKDSQGNIKFSINKN